VCASSPVRAQLLSEPFVKQAKVRYLFPYLKAVGKVGLTTTLTLFATVITDVFVHCTIKLAI